MDADIQFGELEESRPEVHLRPDRNRQYAVAAYESPRDDDLPIFVDLDVMQDMESHALDDTSVELGGVLLGGQFEDEDGQPFVMVTDSLRAQHYEATKGSFKFTHETWEQFSRERDEFPDDLQMVGWYHTHPDWGVFLSGMDMFICDNFFNKPLDLALVIDPCRRDRGMFMWTGNDRERIRRTSGFYIIASRHRRYELEVFSCQLEGKLTMSSDSRFGGVAGRVGPSPAPIVNLTDSRGQWQGPAVFGMLTMQFFVLCLIAWKLLVPPPAEPESEKQTKAIVAIETKLDQMQESAIEQRARKNLLANIVDQLKGGDGLVEKYEDLAKRTSDAEFAAKANQDYATKLIKERDTLKSDVAILQKDYDGQKNRLDAKMKQLEDKDSEIRKHKADISQLNDELKKLKNPEETEDTGNSWVLYVTIAVGGFVLILIVSLLVGKHSGDEDDEDNTEDGMKFKPTSEDAPEETNNNQE